jgi:hypothetical protein
LRQEDHKLEGSLSYIARQSKADKQTITKNNTTNLGPDRKHSSSLDSCVLATLEAEGLICAWIDVF